MSWVAGALIARGFFSNGAVGNALAAGTVVAVVAATVGMFTVLRGQSFAGESFGDIGTAGGSGAYLVGVGPLWGFVVGNALAAAAMELVGIQRPRGRDLATGIVLGAAIGLAALFLYLYSTSQATGSATQSVLFGSLFAITGSMFPLLLGLSAVTLALSATIAAPLLLGSVSPEIAAARGVPVRLVGAAHLLALALAAALAALTIGTILSTALLVGPPASALRLARTPLRALALAAALGVGAVLVGVVLAYDSYDWPPTGRGWPVSFFVVALIFLTYLLSGLPARVRARRARAGAGASAGPDSADALVAAGVGGEPASREG